MYRLYLNNTSWLNFNMSIYSHAPAMQVIVNNDTSHILTDKSVTIVVYGNPTRQKYQNQTELCSPDSTVQKYKGRPCCKLNCAKVQRSTMLQTQLCKSTKVVLVADSTVQKFKGHPCCKLNCAKVVFVANSTVQKCKDN